MVYAWLGIFVVTVLVSIILKRLKEKLNIKTLDGKVVKNGR